MTMRRRVKANGHALERRQSSIWYVPPTPDEAERRFFMRRDQFYVSMFTEDLGLHVMPPWLNRDDDSTRLRIDPENRATESLLSRAFSIRDGGDSYDLAYPFSQFIRMLTSEL